MGTLLKLMFSSKFSVEKLRERRDKLRERLKNGPHEIVQEYLKMGKHNYIENNVITIVLFQKISIFLPQKAFTFESPHPSGNSS